MLVWRPRQGASYSSGVGQKAAPASRRNSGIGTTLRLAGLHRLKKQNRLSDAAAFNYVFKGAARSRDKWFTVLYRENKKDIARLGLAIARKHCRHATGRNRIKRLVRESFRHHQDMLAGLDIVVMNQPAATMASNRQLFDSLATHWLRCSAAANAKGVQD